MRKLKRWWWGKPRTYLTEETFTAIVNQPHLSEKELRSLAYNSYASMHGESWRYRLLDHPSALRYPDFLRAIANTWRTTRAYNRSKDTAFTSDMYLCAVAHAHLANLSPDPIVYYRGVLSQLSGDTKDISDSHKRARKMHLAMTNGDTSTPAVLLDAIMHIVLFSPSQPSPLLPPEAVIVRQGSINRQNFIFGGSHYFDMNPFTNTENTLPSDILESIISHHNVSEETLNFIGEYLLYQLRPYERKTAMIQQNITHIPEIPLFYDILHFHPNCPEHFLLWACQYGTPSMRKTAMRHPNTPEEAAITVALSL